MSARAHDAVTWAYLRWKPIACPRRARSRARRPQTVVFSLVSFYHRGAQEFSCTRMGGMAARKTAHVTEVTAPHSTRIITCANHKGGTGKTTTAVNVSAGLALLTQQRVLLVDCDPRGHASMALGVDSAHVRYSVTDLLMGAMTDVQALCWETGDNLKLLPANATLKDVEPELLRSVDGRLQLKHALQPLLDAFDVIVIDTPPTLGIWTQA